MTNALKELVKLDMEAQRAKYPNHPPTLIIKPTYSTSTANGLTKAIVKYITLLGGMASRINSTGVYDKETGAYRTGTTKRGFSDINACYKGRAIYIEVKIGRDKQSEHQKRFEQQIQASGGLYFIAKDFDSFYNWFNETVLNKKGATT